MNRGCNKVYRTRTWLEKHIIECDPRNVRCIEDDCSEKFVTKAERSKHMKNDHKINLICDYCEIEFIKISKKVSHVEKNHTCIGCNKTGDDTYPKLIHAMSKYLTLYHSLRN